MDHYNSATCTHNGHGPCRFSNVACAKRDPAERGSTASCPTTLQNAARSNDVHTRTDESLARSPLPEAWPTCRVRVAQKSTSSLKSKTAPKLRGGHVLDLVWQIDPAGKFRKHMRRNGCMTRSCASESESESSMIHGGSCGRSMPSPRPLQGLTMVEAQPHVFADVLLLVEEVWPELTPPRTFYPQFAWHAADDHRLVDWRFASPLYFEPPQSHTQASICSCGDGMLGNSIGGPVHLRSSPCLSDEYHTKW
jgi:hypothetical protein